MGKGKYGKVAYFRQRQPSRKKNQSAKDPQEQLKNLSPLELANGINNLIEALKAQGVAIRDYDNKEKRLYCINQVKGQLYYLAAEPKKEGEDHAQ